MTVVVSGPGFADGLLDSSSTRRPGIVTLTDLTPTVAGWLGRPVPAGTVGARIGRTARGELAPTIRALLGRDTAEQVWLATHGWFFAGYALADALAFGLPALLFWGADEERRRARARCWRIAGVLAAAVPLATYLANLIPWWRLAHPAWWLYGLAVGWTLVGGGGGAGRPVAARPARPVRPDLPGHPGPARGRRDDGFPAAAGVAVRPVAARLRPVLRDRQRRARRVLRQRAGRGGLARPRAAAAGRRRR